jgi:hypothetical protein
MCLVNAGKAGPASMTLGSTVFTRQADGMYCAPANQVGFFVEPVLSWPRNRESHKQHVIYKINQRAKK